MTWLTSFLHEFYGLISEMAPYLLLGFLFAGILKAFIPAEGIVRFMGGNNLRSVTNAALLGVPLPLCSCGVLPTAISFFRNGASKASTTSFLISTPQTGVDSILATYAMLGLPFAVIRPFVALVTGIAGGTISSLVDKRQNGIPVDRSGMQEARPKMIERFRQVFTYGFGDLIEDIAKWLVIGLLVAALLSLLIPDAFFTQYIGNPWIEMLIVLAASVPLYICATGSIPLAAVLLMKGLSPGAALVLLMAGPATNVATMLVISKTMGKRSFLVYLGTIIAGALLFGFLVNEWLPSGWFLVGHAHQHEHSTGGSWVNLLSAVILGSLLLLAFLNKWRKRRSIFTSVKVKTMENSSYTLIQVAGMTCSHCKATVENHLSSLPGVDEASADVQSGVVKITGAGFDLSQVENRINELGYEYKGTL